MKKKVDERIRTLIDNGVKCKHRSIFVIVGDKGRNLVVFLHQMLSRAVVKANPSVLWCYKKELFLSSHKKKRMKQVKKMMQRGLMDSITEDPFSVFVASTEIRYCYYAETEKILGNTFGMCVLQDFEALTPNLLARTIETVEGGGIILLLLSSLSSLSSLYTMTMDVHSRFRTEAHDDVTGRFNERFILSLASCKSCVVMDDEFNILPVSSHLRSIIPNSLNEEEVLTGPEQDLKELKSSLRDTQPVGPLVGKCKTLDQAKAVITFLDAVSEKTLRSTVALTAARGRGKSAALGVAIAGAVALGYSNIFVTAPSPENLKTLFQFVFRGFDALEYKEHLDYDMVESTNPDFNKAVVRVNIYRQHRQTIQYIQPQEREKLAQAELVVIDEAAAIPLPIVKALLGPYLVFLCSTVNGYEGTGRSLSLKLIQQLREQGHKNSAENGAVSGRIFREVELAEPIRYSAGDPVEAWLNELLCLNAANHIPKLEGRLPHPNECRLYYVNRDTLFSFHKASEVFLQRMMALYVASHYKNTPNDLQLMSDAPAHHLFVLLGPVDESQNTMPDILCVAQVCLEGRISKESALRSLSEGTSPSGDQIPWKISEQFQDTEFPSLSGVRIVRIAVHPSLVRAGYGSATVDLLSRYYEGQLTDLAEVDNEPVMKKERERITEAAEKVSLLEEVIKPRSDLPPLLVGLNERVAEKIQYLGVSFGLTLPLHNFWHKHNFQPLYIGQIPNAITGEHSCIAVRALETEEVELKSTSTVNWLQPFNHDFRRRFMNLLGSCFRSFAPALALSVLDPKISFSDQEAHERETLEGMFEGSSPLLTPYDMKRLESYANNLVDYHLILDLVSTISRFYFLEGLPTTLSYGQAAILLCLGLQHQNISYIESQLNLPRNQILALFNKSIRKLHNQLHKAAARKIEAALPRLKEVSMNPHLLTVEEDLDDAARQVKADMRQKLEEMLSPEDLEKYAISAEADNELSKVGKLPKSGFVSVKGPSTTPPATKKDRSTPEGKSSKRRNKKEHGNSSFKKAKK